MGHSWNGDGAGKRRVKPLIISEPDPGNYQWRGCRAMENINKVFRVGISGSYGGMNLGDEAILQSIVRELRNSLPVEITVFSPNPKDSLSRHDVESGIPQLNGCGDKVCPYLSSELSPRSTCTEPPADSRSHCVGSALYSSPRSRVFTPNSPVLPSPLS